ncbi:hypothetical protein ECH7EC4076_3494, partial [Escherichia coli O157:H7 str. EC4076]
MISAPAVFLPILQVKAWRDIARLLSFPENIDQ